MARIPLVKVETGPIIGPALETANRIREGRARAAIAEETARTYPEERRARQSLLDESVKRAPMETEAKRQDIDTRKVKEERDAAREERIIGKDEMEMHLARIAAADKIFEDVTTPEEYQRRYDMTIKRQSFMKDYMDPLSDEDRDPETFARKYEDQYKQRSQLKLDLKDRELRSREAVARIYADAREGAKRDYNKLTGTDRRIIDQNIRQEYRDEYEEWVPAKTGRGGSWQPKQGAPPYNKAWRVKRYKENVARYEDEVQDTGRKFSEWDY